MKGKFYMLYAKKQTQTLFKTQNYKQVPLHFIASFLWFYLAAWNNSYLTIGFCQPNIWHKRRANTSVSKKNNVRTWQTVGLLIGLWLEIYKKWMAKILGRYEAHLARKKPSKHYQSEVNQFSLSEYLFYHTLQKSLCALWQFDEKREKKRC